MAQTLELHLVGIGTGNPDHLTLEAIRTLDRADLILLPRKGEDKADLLDLRRGICERLLSGHARVAEFDLPVRAATDDYLAAVADWHAAIAAELVEGMNHPHLFGSGKGHALSLHAVAEGRVVELHCCHRILPFRKSGGPDRSDPGGPNAAKAALPRGLSVPQPP